MMTRLLRGIYIVFIVLRYGLDELVLTSFQKPGLRLLARIVSVGRDLSAPRGQRLREALERLGPIFVKFGQVLSTRRDLLPPDIAKELAKLQDRVPPFASDVAVGIVERAFGRTLNDIFVSFERQPVASASIAQVHFAVVKDRNGTEREVAVKVLRPGMLTVIDKDLSLMRMMAAWVDRLSSDGKRLKPREVVAEFDKYLHDELDLVREAANAAQLRRNMEGLDLVLIPEIFWDFCHTDVMVMERMKGVPISQTDRLREAILSAMADVNQQLTNYKATQLLAGHTSLELVPGPDLAEERIWGIHYRHAILSHVQANMAEQYRNFDTTGTGDKKAEPLEATADLHRRNLHHALAAITQRPRCTVELI